MNVNNFLHCDFRSVGGVLALDFMIVCWLVRTELYILVNLLTILSVQLLKTTSHPVYWT